MEPKSPSVRRPQLAALLPPAQLLTCTVIVKSKEIVLQFEPSDYVQTLVHAAQKRFASEHGGDPTQIIGLRHRRSNRDLYYFNPAGDDIANGDVLEARPYTAAPPSVSERAMSMASLMHGSMKEKLSRCGLFSVVVLRAVGYDEATLQRHLAVSVQLQPYARISTTHGSTSGRWDTIMKLKHTDGALRTLVLDVSVHILDAPTPALGHVRIPVSGAIVAAGVTTEEWVPLESLSGNADDDGSAPKLLLSYCFHPTVSDLPLNAAKVRPSASLLQARGPTKKAKPVPAPDAMAKPAPRGHLSVHIKGLHICGPQCSKLDGHSLAYVPDFDPVLSVAFEENVKEIYVHAPDGMAVVYKKRFSVNSIHSELRLDVLRPMALAATPNLTKLQSGKQAVRYGSLSLGTFEILQRAGARRHVWSPPPPMLGPGRQPPAPHFEWVVLRQGDDDVGLVQLQVEYIENLRAIVSPELHEDATFVRPDEVEFKGDIIKRNIERLDLLFSVAQSAKLQIREILEWRNPLLTLSLWVGSTLGVLYFPTSHCPLVLLLAVAALLVVNYVRYARGGIQKTWTEYDPDEIQMKLFRSIATLHVVPRCAANLIEAKWSEMKQKDALRPLDTHVELYYEPHFKELPPRLIARTNSVLGSRSPEYGRDDAGDICLLNNNWFKELFTHLSPHAKDAVLHDVEEAWKRDDGSVDQHAFKYPILQPVRTNPITELEELVPWEACPGILRLDVVQENAMTSRKLLGQVRYPIKDLVTSSRIGGPQVEVERALPLLNTPLTDVEGDDVPTLTVRVQLTLRDPTKPVSWKERLASEALYSVMEIENAKSLSFVEKYHMARNVARTIQHEIGKVCDLLEKIKNVFLWTHPRKTALVLLVVVLGIIVTYIVPAKYFVVYQITRKFTNRFHRLCDRRLIDGDVIRIWNFIATFPSDMDEQKMFRFENQAYLREKEHSSAQAKLQADWAGYIWKRGENLFVGWAHRYAAIRNGKLEYWSTMDDAKHGVPPKGHILLSSTIEKCTKTELASAPKDTYPVAIFNVHRRHLLDAPDGRRRVIAVTTEVDLHDLIRAIRAISDA
ncbi:hypothetical protein SPRG_19273 [Saprolegnia parasitica CBS 223.65]|uniref:C2 domain-containing protein n=1 Tax=Saprolegnia parasitica (strain CBS 223.65) TaxID=695850 RepID=A0A067CWP0_SAPPC|nr:hypothetical protein SPRG_19273 [Saprolegnia parasitica CBS 223.65]KDO33660.1 hypothetical protein SPRG_19273 [Saprolegnia parasitica CBS 223.65]|eukprot:XP_012195690.1 hypothetical protein SPRG_19273 [Saprolegnia parasitica CBS 223.65]